MSDLDRYLTEEVLEKAAVAIQLVVSVQNEIHLKYVPEYEDLPDEHKQQRQHEARRALEAVLPDIIRQVKAEALREAARTYQWGGWARNPQARGDMGAKSRQAEHAVKWLRDLADQIEGAS